MEFTINMIMEISIIAMVILLERSIHPDTGVNIGFTVACNCPPFGGAIANKVHSTNFTD